MANHENRGARRSPCVHPRGEDVRKAQKRAGLTHDQCAALVCVSPVTWQLWHDGARVMPCGAWKLFRYEVGMMAPAAPPGEYQFGWPQGDPRKQ